MWARSTSARLELEARASGDEVGRAAGASAVRALPTRANTLAAIIRRTNRAAKAAGGAPKGA